MPVEVRSGCEEQGRPPVSGHLVLVLQMHPILNRAQIIAEVQRPGRLNAGEDPSDHLIAHRSARK